MRKKIFYAMLIVMFCLVLVPQKASAYPTSDWMKLIDGKKTLAEISIPGTHDSGATHEHVRSTAKCQSLTISQQLDIGVRYLDVRCRHFNNTFEIHHGAIHQHINFDNVLDACITFLNRNPSETIIMSIKEEHKPSGNTRTFEQTFDYYRAKNPNKWLLTNTIPTLDKARGKIVLLRRFAATNLPKGIDATVWKDNTSFEIRNSVNMKIQDIYKVPNREQKWSNITSMYNEAKTQNPSWLYINYTSGYKPLAFNIPDITNTSNFINPKLKDFFTINSSGRFGITAMDFVDAELAHRIISTNNIK